MIVVLLEYPVVVFAQFTSGVNACDPSGSALIGSDFSCTVYRIVDIIYLIIPLLIGCAFIVFFWGLSKFILNSGSKTEIENGKNYMMWGIIVLFVLLTFRTIIGLIATDLEIGNSTGLPFLPTGTTYTP